MPTYDRLDRFDADFRRLDEAQQEAFRAAVSMFIQDLQRGNGFRKSLRVKGVRGARGVYEMTWANDGRATFSYGNAVQNGEAHIIWRRVGTHGIFATP